MVRVSLQAALTVSSVVCSGVRWPPNSSARASRCRVRQRTPSSSGWPSDRCMRPAESSSRLRWALHVPERACSSSKSSGVPESMRTTGRAQRDACSGPPQREEPVASGTDSIFFRSRVSARGTERRCQHGAYLNPALTLPPPYGERGLLREYAFDQVKCTRRTFNTQASRSGA